MTLADTQTSHAPATRPARDETVLARKILLTVLMVLIAWGLAIAKWGVPGLYLPALAMVPVMYVILILISRG
ncbi:hypothetical protein SAMN05216196_105351 [Lutimaribacter pacificus]|uniref:Uncharacterized protein n=1 Tax=Lutimaribacter pacificus TaxID=391948 RepID=A0A1H0JP82_9RHOB|nr:hypothetical protein [Lutimaribacter pacificus]SDO45322.1 hypothetical protein SAMN05216196_105351 [Lutimaribacter pacificus]SHK08132.1 hypothetical protein SAMN05444142_103189 [Lutimaribacter pacificus]